MTKKDNPIPLVQFYTKQQVADRFHLSPRTIEDKSRQYELTFKEMRSNPSNSPANGLRRTYTCETRYLFDERDLVEYEMNGLREKVGEPLANWRGDLGSCAKLAKKGKKRNVM